MTLRFLAPGALALVLAAASLSGCTTNRLPRLDMSTGAPVAFRRYTGRPAVDYISRWDTRAFKKVDGLVDGALSEDMLEALNRHGQPDYLRDHIDAERDETFNEWVFWDRNVLVQFIQGELVYEGPLLDSDRTLVNYGYPTSAYVQQYETGPRRETWIYQHLLTTEQQTFSFSDGSLIYQSQQ